MAKIENKSEFDAYMEAVVPYMTTFMNELEDGNHHVVERTVAQMKQRFALDDAQEAALQIVLFNLETMHYGCHDEFPFEAYMGLAINTVVDITLKDWRTICDKRLAEPPAELMDYEDDENDDGYAPNEVMEAMNAYRELLTNYYATEKGSGKEFVEAEQVGRAFFIADEDADKTMNVLDKFVSKMDKLKKGTTQEAVARLLDQTIEKLMKLSSRWEE